jgi:wyosine [tRNA(Phe)-imidazoG37] synthetase (radical SAM superfamily)
MNQKPINFDYSAKFSIKNWKGQYCLSPFCMIQIQTDGQVRLCGCGAWMPITVGNILTTPLAEILASPLAQSIRRSIIDGTYEYCNEKICGVIQNNGLNTIDTVPPNIQPLLKDASQFQMPYEISLHGDHTCNLSCPSCRTRVIKVDDKDIIRQEEVGQLIFNNLFSVPTTQRMNIITSGTGEVFASPMLLNFLKKINLDQYPNVVFHLCTNGLLCKKRWDLVKHLEPNIERITVSIDATCAPTYEKLRRGGNWDSLLENMEFLKNKCADTGMKFHTRMIVQQDNQTEILKFYEFSKNFNADVVEYSRITNWGSYTPAEFKLIDVFEKSHSGYQNASKQIEIVKLNPDVWFEGDFS